MESHTPVSTTGPRLGGVSQWALMALSFSTSSLVSKGALKKSLQNLLNSSATQAKCSMAKHGKTLHCTARMHYAGMELRNRKPVKLLQ